MIDLELYSEINKTLSTLAWPSTFLLVLALFKRTITNLLDRAARVEGKFGDLSFKVSLQEIMHEKVSEAIKLKAEGKESEADALINSSIDIVSSLYALSQSDIEELVSLSQGGKPKRNWGKAHLVRAGLVELKGGGLTNNGKIIVNKYLRQDA